MASERNVLEAGLSHLAVRELIQAYSWTETTILIRETNNTYWAGEDSGFHPKTLPTERHRFNRGYPAYCQSSLILLPVLDIQIISSKASSPHSTI
jgi:hypothetical protein